MSESDLRPVPPNWPIESDWTRLLQGCFSRIEFQKLIEFVNRQRQSARIFPSAADVFNAFRYSSFADTRVVLLGQDPYHGAGQAHGLAFSVPENVKLPPSLRNIFKELADDLGQFGTFMTRKPVSGNLTSWARQGVMLLNAELTVAEGQPNSHRNQGWEILTDQTVRLLGHREQRCVFILWGKSAEKKSELILKHHKVIRSAHPSPLSAHRGFFGSRPFSAANMALIDFGQHPVDWMSVFRQATSSST